MPDEIPTPTPTPAGPRTIPTLWDVTGYAATVLLGLACHFHWLP